MVLLIASFTGLVGIAFGYFLRWIITLGKRGSLELEIKQKVLEAKESAQKIVSDAERLGKEKIKELTKEFHAKEEDFKQRDVRIVKKEELLDKRQQDIEREVEAIKKKIADIREVKARAEKLEQEKQAAIERVASMSREAALEELMKSAERQSEENLLIRMQKLETLGQE